MKTIKMTGMLAVASVTVTALLNTAAAQQLTSGSSQREFQAESAAISEITAPVVTGFGVYQPYAVPDHRVIIGLNEPAPDPNFGNVAAGEFARNQFTRKEQAMLAANGFAARPEAIGSFGQAYAHDGMPAELGAFITVDALLHGLRVTADEAVRAMERNYAAPLLSTVLEDISGSLAGQLTDEKNQALADPLGRLLAYIQTGEALLNPSTRIDTRVEDAVRAELENIRAGQPAPSAILPNRHINYAEFQPGDYYTLDETLSRYYQAKTWFSSVGLSLRSDNGTLAPTEARMAFILARTMDRLAASGDFRSRYQGVYEPLAYFDGRSDYDLNWEMLAGSIRAYYGIYAEAGIDYLADNEGLAGFITYTEDQFPQPRHHRSGTRQFRLLNSGFDLDAALLAGTSQKGSSGSGLQGVGALAPLSGRSNTSGPLTAAAERPAAEWAQNFEMSTLYAVEPLMRNRSLSNGYPRFMRNEAWVDRSRTSALGAWASYRHPLNMLPATLKATRTANTNGNGVVYVEPAPEAWSRVASLAGHLRSGFTEGENGRMIPTGIEEKLRDIENTAALLMQIAAAELEGKALSENQADLLATMGTRIAAYETFLDRSLTSDGAVSVLGVTNVGRNASPANGHPLALYVIVPTTDNGLMLTRGAVYSYYETEASESEWRDIMTTSDADIRPPVALTGRFVSGEGNFGFPAGELDPVEAFLPSAATSYIPTDRKGRKISVQKAELKLEANVVRRSVGELWYTVQAPHLEGSDVIVTVSGSSGQTVFQSRPLTVRNGEHYNMIDVNDLNAGHYFLRVADMTGNTVALGRFMVVR